MSRAGFRFAASLPSPLLLLAVEALVVFLTLAAAPDFTTQWDNDSRGYVQLGEGLLAERSDLAGLLANKRTLGYPLFLGLSRPWLADFARLPEVQLGLFLAAVLALGAAVRRASGSGWLAFFTASPLCFSRLARDQAPWLMSDLLAATCGLLTAASLLWLVAEPRRKLAWLALSISVASAYHVRPAYLFLVAVVPLFGWVMARERRGRFALALAALTLCPLLGYAALRFALVGHFGLVSFGGLNAVGVTASFLTPEVAARLPPELRELGLAIAAKRAELGLAAPGPDLPFVRWREQFNPNVWQAALPAAQELAARQGGSVTAQAIEVNRRLSALSRALVAARPDLYLAWIGKGTGWAFDRLRREPTVRIPALALAVVLPLWLAGLSLARASGRRLELGGSLPLALLAALYALGSYAVVILVESPIDRYVFAAALLLPAACTALIFDLVRSLVPAAREGEAPPCEPAPASPKLRLADRLRPLRERPLLLLRLPGFWFTAAAGLVLLRTALDPAVKTQWYSDSTTYTLGFLGLPLEEILGRVRTFGYPLFLGLVDLLPGGLDHLPLAQLFAHCLAAGLFYRALAAYSGKRGWALAAALPLLFAPLQRDLADSVMADSLASSLAVATIALLFAVLARPERKVLLAALALTLFLAYQTRPAYLFLVGLVPLLGFFFALEARTWRGLWVTLRRPTLALAAAALLPLLAWSTLRFAVVGHFGLVSFGGANLIGITGPMLTPQLVRELPKEDRPLARKMIQRRAELGLSVGPAYDFELWRREYNLNVHDIALYELGKKHPLKPGAPGLFWVAANHELSHLSASILRARPRAYLHWVTDATRASLKSLLAERIVLLPLLLCLVLGGLAAFLLRRDPSLLDPALGRAAAHLALAAGGFLAASLLLIVAVESPIPRYVLATGALLPSALAGLTALAALVLARAWRGKVGPRLPPPAVLLLAAQALLVFFAFAWDDNFRTQETSDSREYQWHESASLRRTVFNDKRTVGYPLFLEAVRLATGDLTYAAHAQLAAYLAAVLAFGLLARRAFGAWTPALAAASPLFYARLLRLEAHHVLTDVLAAAAAVVTVGFLLVVTREPRLRWGWVGLAAALAATYHIRPAYLFLLAVVPLAGCLFALRRELSSASFKRALFGFGLAAALPYLAWSSARYLVTGHFGLVAFGGLNIIGVTAPMINEALLPRLPEAERPLAAAVLQLRREMGLPAIEPWPGFRTWSGQFNKNAHKVAWRAWARLYGEARASSASWMEANAAFARLSKAVILARPGLYARWLWEAHCLAWERLTHARTIRWPGLACLALALVWLWQRSRRRLPAPRLALDFALLTGIYTAASLLLVVLVEPPIERYIFASGIFLPSALTLLTVELGRSLFTGGAEP